MCLTVERERERKRWERDRGGGVGVVIGGVEEIKMGA